MIDDREALAWLRDNGFASVSDFAKHFSLSRSTAHRTMKRLTKPSLVAANGHSVIAEQNHVVSPVPLAVPTVARTVSLCTILRAGGCLIIAAIGGAVSWYAFQINAWYGATLGRAADASYYLANISRCADALSLVMPLAAGSLWWAKWRAMALTCWAFYLVTIGVTGMNAAGFASLNIADTSAARERVTAERSMLTQKMGRLARDRADALTALARGDHPVRAGRRRDDYEKQLAEVEDKLSALPAVLVSDPQADTVASLVRWATFGLITVSPDDVRVARLAGMIMMPLSGGLVILIATALWQSRRVP